MTQSSTYDFRLRPLTLAQTGSSAAAETLTYSWAPNGNLNTEMIANGQISGGSVVQTFGCDTVNRLTSAAESGNRAASQTFGYDAFGHRWVQLGYNPYSAVTPTSSSFSNKWTGASYDAAGNLQTPAGVVSTAAATYDAENRLITMHDTSSSNPVQFPLTYCYDADDGAAH